MTLNANIKVAGVGDTIEFETFSDTGNYVPTDPIKVELSADWENKADVVATPKYSEDGENWDTGSAKTVAPGARDHLGLPPTTKNYRYMKIEITGDNFGDLLIAHLHSVSDFEIKF